MPNTFDLRYRITTEWRSGAAVMAAAYRPAFRGVVNSGCAFEFRSPCPRAWNLDLEVRATRGGAVVGHLWARLDDLDPWPLATIASVWVEPGCPRKPVAGTMIALADEVLWARNPNLEWVRRDPHPAGYRGTRRWPPAGGETPSSIWFPRSPPGGIP